MSRREDGAAVKRLWDGDASDITHVVHIADLHLRLGNPEVARITEYRAVMHALLDQVAELPAVRAGRAVMVIAGDVAHSKGRLESPGGTLFFEWMNRARRLLPVLLICGNHDFRQEAPDVPDMIELFTAPYAAADADDNAQCHAVHYLRDTGLYHFRNVGFGVVSVKDTLRATSAAGVVDALPPFPPAATLLAQPGVTHAVALFHGTIAQSALPSGRAADAVMRGYPLEWISGAGYPIIMLGDNHKQQVHAAAPPHHVAWGYPGSLVQQDFGEPVSGHGYILWDLAARAGAARDVPNPCAAVTVRVDHDGDKCWACLDPRAPPVPLEDAVRAGVVPPTARLRVQGSEADAVAVVARMRAALSGTDTSPVVVRPASIKVSPPLPSPPPTGTADARDAAETSPAGDGGPTLLQLSDLTRPEQWEAYLGALADDGDEQLADLTAIREWLHAPARMAVPVPPELPGLLPETARAAAQARNDRLRPLLDRYEAEAHRVSDAPRTAVTLRYLEWDNLMCYGARNHFDFDALDGRVALLNGANASGKSAFLDVLFIALFGEPTAQRRDFTGDAMTVKIIYDNKPDGDSAHALLRLTVEGEGDFELHRSFTAGARGGTVQPKVTAVYRLPDGGDTGSKTVVAEGAVTVRAWVHARVGRPEELLMSTVLSQHDHASFFFHKPDDQRQVLERALRMEAITAYEKVLDEAVNAHRYVLADVTAYHRGAADSVAAILAGLHAGDAEVDVTAADDVDTCARAVEEALDASRAALQEAEEGALSELEARAAVLRRYADVDTEHLVDSPSWDEASPARVQDDLLVELATLDADRERALVLRGQLEQRRRALLACQGAGDEDEMEGDADDDDIEHDDQKSVDTLRAHLARLRALPQPPALSSLDEQTDASGEISEDEDTEGGGSVDALAVLWTRYGTLGRAEMRLESERAAALRALAGSRPAHGAAAVAAWRRRWRGWTELKARVPRLPAAELRAALDARGEATEAEDAVGRQEAELRVLAAVDLNPECAACRRQPMWERREAAQAKLEIAQRRLQAARGAMEQRAAAWRSAGMPQPLDQDTDITSLLEARLEYDAQADAMRAERAAWIEAAEQAKALSTVDAALGRCRRRRARVGLAWQRAWGLQVREAEDALRGAERRARRNEWAALRADEAAAAGLLDRVASAGGRAARALASLESHLHAAQHRVGALRTRVARLQAVVGALRRKQGVLQGVQAAMAALQARTERLKVLRARFLGNEVDAPGFKTFVYERRVLPLLEREANTFLAGVDAFRLRIRLKGARLIFMLDDRGCTPTLDHASGYQRFVTGLAMRVALARVGAVGRCVRHLFLDEGFVACDADNLQKTSDMLQDLMALGGYRSMLLMSHLDVIRDAVGTRITIRRNPGDACSLLQWGARRAPVPKAAPAAAAGRRSRALAPR